MDSGEGSVWDRIGRWARTRPDSVAVEGHDGSLTFGELWTRSQNLARTLSGQGIKAGDPVALLCLRGPDFVVAALACWLAGGAYVPLDPLVPARRREMVLSASGAQVVIASDAYLECMTGSDVVVVSVAAGRSGEELRPQAPAGHAAYVIFTSGTTGVPKGVVVAHEALDNLLGWVVDQHSLLMRDRVLHTYGLGFDAAVVELWPTLVAGATVVACSDTARVVPEFLVEEAAAKRCSVVWATTAIVEHIIRQELPLPGVRLLLTGGDVLRVRPARPATYRLVNHYGPTEATVITTSHLVAPGSATDDSPPSIGSPIAGVVVSLAGTDDQEVALGATGEILIGGRNLALGYLGDPDLTDAAFVVRHGQRWYRTGDLGVRDENGLIQFRGRKNADQLKLNGQRIEAGEIEAALLEIPGVLGACVVLTDVGLGAVLVSDVGANWTSPGFVKRYEIVCRGQHTRNGSPMRTPSPSRRTGKSIDEP